MIPTDPNALTFKKAKFKNKTASTAKSSEYAIEVVNGVFSLSAAGVAAPVSSSAESVEAASDTLTAVQCYGGQVNNYGQAGNVVLALPAAAAGMQFLWQAGSTAAFYYRIDPAAGDSIYLDGVTTGDGKYVGLATVTKGDWIQFVAFKTGAASYDWTAVSYGAWASEA